MTYYIVTHTHNGERRLVEARDSRQALGEALRQQPRAIIVVRRATAQEQQQARVGGLGS